MRPIADESNVSSHVKTSTYLMGQTSQALAEPREAPPYCTCIPHTHARHY